MNDKVIDQKDANVEHRIFRKFEGTATLNIIASDKRWRFPSFLMFLYRQAVEPGSIGTLCHSESFVIQLQKTFSEAIESWAKFHYSRLDYN